jgi:hypothetical protein
MLVDISIFIMIYSKISGKHDGSQLFFSFGNWDLKIPKAVPLAQLTISGSAIIGHK